MKITAGQYAQSLYSATEGKPKEEIKKIISGFLKLLRNNRQIKNTGKIIQKFNEIWDKENQVMEIEVVSRRKLDPKIREEITKFVRKKYAAKEVVINSREDENILGGIIIKMEDEVLDASLKGQLHKFKKYLTV